jgi:hypothetical protein
MPRREEVRLLLSAKAASVSRMLMDYSEHCAGIKIEILSRQQNFTLLFFYLYI